MVRNGHWKLLTCIFWSPDKLDVIVSEEFNLALVGPNDATKKILKLPNEQINV